MEIGAVSLEMAKIPDFTGTCNVIQNAADWLYLQFIEKTRKSILDVS
jgi:hypothetical protein